MRRADKVRVLAAVGLVVAFMALKLHCKRDPSAPVHYNTCHVYNAQCTCESSARYTDQGTCGTFECCYRFEQHSHANVHTVCTCGHGNPETHASAKPQPFEVRVDSCP